MAHTYSTRLTLVHPKKANMLDPRLGRIIAESAATGRFIMGDINWESAVGPNADTTVAYHATGEFRIFEPLGMSLFDYIKAAAYEAGIDNHLDARFLLEIEIIAEKMKEAGTGFKYIWPVMILATEVKSSVTERGTEYIVRFVHLPYHTQTDLVQPVKETITVTAPNLKDYFRKLQNELETREYKYALARQKAGGTKAPGGDNPAANDPLHDEYHFILDPRIENFSFTSKGSSDRAIQGGFLNRFRSQKIWDVSIRPGTTIIQQINRILKSTEDIANLLPGKKTPQTSDASGSSQASANNLLNQLGSVYQFFRIETHCVYKEFDYIRSRYAAKYIFFIFLADQPNMYHYPDELNLLNQLKNKDKALTKLKYYIQEGLLRKLYYHNYTGLNTDILKVDLNFNQAYFLPSFPVIWMDRGYTGPGLQGPQNNSDTVNPYNHADDLGPTRRQVSKLRQEAGAINAEILNVIKDAGGENILKRAPGLGISGGSARLNELSQKYKELKQREEKVKQALSEKEKELATKEQATAKNLNTINDRKQLLENLKGQYIEDLNGESFKRLLENYVANDYPNIRPRMEADDILSQIDDPKKENERLMEKIFAVQIAPRDIVELELEIIGDPYWLGAPNFLLQGKKHLEKIQFTPDSDKKVRDKVNEVMPKLDPGWNDRNPVWGQDFNISQHYKGAPLFYFLSQIPDSEFTEDDMIKFNPNDQIVGIYMVKKVVNDFKEGRWTQKIISVRDVTIPSYILPKTVNGQLSFEEYMKDVSQSADRAKDTMADLRRINEAERAANAAGNKITSTNPPGTNASPTMAKALDAKNNLADQKPDIPVVRNPVDRANELVNSGLSRDQAYSQAKKEYVEQLNAKNKILEEINKKAYAESGVGNYRPYGADTMTQLAITRSGAGGLDTWKSGKAENVGSSIYNNPAGTGYDKSNNSYYRYNNFDEGVEASNDYFNYAANVKSKNKQDAERLLLPKDFKGNELEYLNKKLKSGGGG